MYIKYSKKDGDRKIVSTRFVTGKILSYLYNDSEVKCLPYLIIKRYVPSGATELTHTICCSVAFLCSHDTKEKKKSFTSLYVLT